mgnify:CR=1 FL=1|jgi:Na+-transporting methylmalonyl-CoA/oxaloacetate decarboxylase gamma subunit
MKNSILLIVLTLLMSACASSSLNKETMNDELKQLVDQNRQLREQRVNSLLSNH